MSGHTVKITVGLTLLCAVITMVVYFGAQIAGRSAAEGASAGVAAKARALAAQNERDSVARSVNTCSRGNPGRAYLLLRSGELKSRTARSGAQVWEILDCNRTVAAQGQPIPVPLPVETAYLRLYERGWVPVLNGSRIIGKISATAYFRRPPR